MTSTKTKTTSAHSSDFSTTKTNTPQANLSSPSSMTTSAGEDVVPSAFLPKKVYELLRWLVWIVLPAIATLISILNQAWGWGWPIEAILTTFSGVETFLGTVLGISKIITDAPEMEE